MAVSNIIKKRIGRELLEWVHLGIRTGMRKGVADYRRLVADGRVVDAVYAIKRAVDLPHRARARINEAIAKYTQATLVECIGLALPSGVTLAEINADLTTQETYAQGLVTHRLVDGWTWDQIATDIETNVELEEVRWQFPFPAGYLDVWGE